MPKIWKIMCVVVMLQKYVNNNAKKISTCSSKNIFLGLKLLGTYLAYLPNPAITHPKGGLIAPFLTIFCDNYHIFIKKANK